MEARRAGQLSPVASSMRAHCDHQVEGDINVRGACVAQIERDVFVGFRKGMSHAVTRMDSLEKWSEDRGREAEFV